MLGFQCRFLCSHRLLGKPADWALPYTEIYYFLHFITFVSFLCLIAFVKIIMPFLMGTSEHPPECVRFSCCVVSAKFGEVMDVGDTHT